MSNEIKKAFEAMRQRRAADTHNINLGLGEGAEPIAGDMLRRTLHPEIRIVDAAKGIVDYIASDETIDSYYEVVRAAGWKFDRMEKNAPFVDSHNYNSIERLLGKVLSWEIKDGQLIERVQWAKDDPEHKLASIGWKLTEAGFLKAVSVGFFPTKWVSRYSDQEPFLKELEKLGYDTDSKIRTIYLEQQQYELSACIIGANPNAVAKAYKADALSDEDLEQLSATTEKLTRTRGLPPGTAAPSSRQAKSESAFLRSLNSLLNK